VGQQKKRDARKVSHAAEATREFRARFAAEIVQALINGRVASNLGSEVCLLITYIAHQPQPTRFFDFDLMVALGFKSQHELTTARNAAAAAGWLEMKVRSHSAIYSIRAPGCELLPEKQLVLFQIRQLGEAINGLLSAEIDDDKAKAAYRLLIEAKRFEQTLIGAITVPPAEGNG
jgi:hypothetical protein